MRACAALSSISFQSFLKGKTGTQSSKATSASHSVCLQHTAGGPCLHAVWRPGHLCAIWEAPEAPPPTSANQSSCPNPASMSQVCLQRKQIIGADQRSNVIIRNTFSTVQLPRTPPSKMQNQLHPPSQGTGLAFAPLLWDYTNVSLCPTCPCTAGRATPFPTPPVPFIRCQPPTRSSHCS